MSVTVFRSFERMFRRGGGVLSEEDAICAGCLDFSSARLRDSACVLELQPPPLPPALAVDASAAGGGASCLQGLPGLGGVFALRAYPGFYMLPGALSAPQRLALARACLQEYIEPPLGRTSVGTSPPGGVWGDYVRPRGPREPPPVLHSLAWATLGVHYDWARRLYPSGEPGWSSPFPAPLAHLCALVAGRVQQAAAAAALPAAPWGLPLTPFAPRTAIVNLYHPSRSRARLPMGGHKDDATGEDQTAPVLSLSMGATAVFLLGGEDKDHLPQPLLLRGGDIMVLAGAARTCLHGVPRVLVPEHGHAEGDIQAEQGSQEARALTRFLASSRINITVRATA